MTNKSQLRMSPCSHREQARLIRNASGSEDMAVHHETLAQVIESRRAEYTNRSTPTRPMKGRSFRWWACRAYCIWPSQVARMLHRAADSC